MAPIEISDHLIIDPDICHGQMSFAGTRIPVDTVLTYLRRGYAVDRLRRSWPEPTPPTVESAIARAYGHA
ncbi:MAG: DUF433 domain-containing protein [Caldilineales bacterium]|nr:DUF433 domain-containing protein [Caldilineales bacterium]MCW5858365.1 DUF433 domain-containing protein [Caldilineales bacterium]